MSSSEALKKMDIKERLMSLLVGKDSGKHHEISDKGVIHVDPIELLKTPEAQEQLAAVERLAKNSGNLRTS